MSARTRMYVLDISDLGRKNSSKAKATTNGNDEDEDSMSGKAIGSRICMRVCEWGRVK